MSNNCCCCSFVSSDFQNMPNAMRPSAPRPQTLNTIRTAATTNTQVPRMMATQRLRKYFIFHFAGIRCIYSPCHELICIDNVLIRFLFLLFSLQPPKHSTSALPMLLLLRPQCVPCPNTNMLLACAILSNTCPPSHRSPCSR